MVVESRSVIRNAKNARGLGKPHSWTRQSIRERDLRKKEFSTCAHILNLLKRFSTLTLTVATHQALKKVLSKERLLDF